MQKQKDKLVVKHYSMPESIAQLITEWSDRTGMNYSEFIRNAVRSYVYQLEDKHYGKKT